MQTEQNRRKSAAKLHDILGTMGFPVSETQCLDVVSDIEKTIACKVPTPTVSDKRRVAEQYMDVVIGGYMEANYQKATQFFEEKYLVNYPERDFKRDALNTSEDTGTYLRREYLGTLKGRTHPEEPDTYPDHTRYVWRGFFEKSERLLIIALYYKNGNYYTSNVASR